MTVALLWILITTSGPGYNGTVNVSNLGYFVKQGECQRVAGEIQRMNNASSYSTWSKIGCIQAEVVVVVK